MRILLFVLKAAGILLLTVLVLLLLILLLLIFYPVSYRIEGSYEDEISLKGRLSWLFSLIRLEFSLDNGTPVNRLKIFGVTCKTSSEREERRRRKKKYKKTKEKKRRTSGKDSKASESGEEPETLPQKIPEYTPAAEEPEVFQSRNTSEPDAEDKKAKQDKTGVDGKSGRFSWKKKFENGKGRFYDIKNAITDENNKDACKHVLKEVGFLLAHFKPKTAEADIQFSTGDPAVTGQLTGILSLMPFLYRKKVSVIPDFSSEEFYIRGSFQITGHVRLFHGLRSLLRLIRDKNIKRIWKQLRA